MPLVAEAHCTDFIYDSATAVSLGRRDRQEDSVASDFLTGAGVGFAVLADGMGGHAAGDVASKLAVTEVFAGLKLWSDAPESLAHHMADVLLDVAEAANGSIADYAARQPDLLGMGTTLLAPVIVHGQLYWISVGDSPLLLFRDGEMTRLNANHSLATYLDQMVRSGQMSERDAQMHPDRHCVTSVLNGAEIHQIDCRHAPVALEPGDVVLAASDGVESLGLGHLAACFRANPEASSAALCRLLLAEVEALNLPEQDNLAFCVVRVAPSDDREFHAQSPQSPLRRRRITLTAHGTSACGISCTHQVEEITP